MNRRLPVVWGDRPQAWTFDVWEDFVIEFEDGKAYVRGETEVGVRLRRSFRRVTMTMRPAR